jgi:hypothetical protein
VGGKKTGKRIVLGCDIGLEDTCRLALCGMVGRFSYNNLNVEKFYVWLEQTWLPVIGYVPEVFFLTKGWFRFLCNCPEDVALLLEGTWVNGTNSLMLKKWRVAFNPETKYFSFCHFWVLLSGLPLFFWNEGALLGIGNALGKFLMVDRVNLGASSRKVCKVLVEMDIHQGLSETLDIEWRGLHFRQSLDYLGIPLRYSYCRSTTHLIRDCKGLIADELT